MKKRISSSKLKPLPLAKNRVTLDRAFSKAGVFSRTEALKKIRSGAVKVNGKVVRDPEHWVSLSADAIQCDGLVLRRQKKVYLMLYKPTGVVTSHGDPDQRKTVYDLLQGIKEWVFPVGRLDMDTSGLLLLTNDTDFGDRLTNPAFKVPKTYLLKINFHLTPEQSQALERGITLSNGEKTLPAKMRLLRQNEKCSFLELVITEGKNRQIRRMIEALGGRVLKLVRTRIGNLAIGDLPIGRYRSLDRRDLAELWKAPAERSEAVSGN